MKKILLFLILPIITFSCTEKPSEVERLKGIWNNQKRSQYLSYRNDTATWDLKMLENDKQQIGIGDLGPFEIGVFPVPNYDLIGKNSFKGLSTLYEQFQLGVKTIIMNGYAVGKSELNRDRLGDQKDEVFFQILILTDTIDNVNYQLNQSVVISRNHPDYLGQGFITTKNNRIDFLAFHTAENNNYAIINTRLFDLNFGKTILIAPQKDKSLRSLQIESPQISSDSIVEYTKEKLLKDEIIIEFFKKTENI